MPVEDILLNFWILEDSPHGDITSEILPEKTAIARIISKDEGILAGMEIVKKICMKFGIDIRPLKNDGERIAKGDIIAEIKGDVRKILLVERLILNLLMYLSGIATTTRRFVDKVKTLNPKVRIAATRKTLPGLRWASKKAVEIGGGDTHRFSLSDCYLIKDNHIRVIGDTAEAVRLAKEKSSFTKLVEVEVRTPEDAVAAAKAGADIIMFDNMDPEDIRVSIDRIRELGLREKLVLEVSGGINLENVDRYAVLDVDVISTSFITLSPKPIDLTLKIHTLETTSREQV